MFEFFSWSYAADAISRLPKEITYAGIAALALNEIHKRHTQVKLAEVKANVRNSELEVEALKLKRELQENGTVVETV